MGMTSLRLIAFCAVSSGATSVWPLPAMMSTGTGRLEVDSALTFTVVPAGSTVVVDAAARCAVRLFEDGPGGASVAATALSEIVITVTDVSATLSLEIDESYELWAPPSGGSTAANLTAATWVGALRGLETFSQVRERERLTLSN